MTRAAVFVLLVLGFGVGFHYASERPTPRRADAERFFLRGNDCVARDDFEGAAEFYAMAADRDPNQWAYWTLTCNALTELGRYDDAEAALRRAESAFRRAGTFDVMRSPVNHMRASIRRRRTGGTPRKTLPDEPLFGREW